jgi:superfamily I DNA/RNA helicase
MAPDIAVLVAGDRDAYLPLLPTIFDEVARVPHHVIGAAAAHAGRLAEALGRILALPGADFTRPELLGVMTHPHVIARYPHCSPDDWRDWVTTLGVYRGADARDHAGTYLEQAPDRYHWAQALDRLTLGAFLGPAEQGEADEVALGRHPLRPEPTTGDQQASAATFVALARSLIADARWLADHAATLTEWAAIFARTCDAYLTAATPDDDQDLARLHATLAELAAGDLDGRVLGFTEVRELLRERLGELRRDRGDVLIDGVTVATLAPMRALPWRHVFVVGLGGAAFPARSRPTPYDLRRGAALTARGDVTAADRDRHAMLEAVLGARASLTLSYVGTHPVSGEALEASAVVYELAEALAPYLGAATAAETLAAITTVHPMHRWSDRYADEPALASARPQAAIRERDAVATQAALARAITAAGADVSPDAAREIVRASPSGAAVRIGLLPPPPPALGRDRAPLATLRLRALTTFLESPVQAWARHVLGLRERDDAEALELAVEPLAVGAPARSGLLRDAFTRLLREPSMAVNDAWRAAAHGLIARGELPAGPFAEAARVRDVEILTQWLDATPRPAGAAPRCWGIGEGRADTTDLAPALRLDVPTPDGGVRRLALVGATELTLVPGDTLVIQQGHNASRRHLYHLRGALHHVIMAAAGLTPDREHTHHVLVGDGSTHAITHDPWSVAEAQAYLARLLGELFGEDHAYLLPLDVALGALGGRPAEALRHDHKEYGPVDSFDGLGLAGPRAPARAGDAAPRAAGGAGPRLARRGSVSAGDAVAWVARPAILPPSAEGALVVEASAGTGKTFFIEHRVADLMIEQGADLEQILLVTFTEKATAELRARVRGQLDRLVHAPAGPRPDVPAWRIDAATRAHLQRALWSMERAAISTIHGFCQRTLGDEALVGRRLLDERQISEEVAFDEAWHALLREQFARDPDDARYLAAYLGGGRKLDELRKTLLSALRKGGELAPAPRAMPPVAEVEAIAALLRAIDDPEAFVRAAEGPAGSIGKATETIRILRRRLAAAESALERVLVFDAALDLEDRLAKLPGALTPKKKAHGTAATNALAHGVRALLPLLQRLPLQIAHRFLPALRARLDEDKLARGQFDYQDLLARLAALLRGPGGDALAARLRARLPWALIDEFQDTDPLQWEIFARVWRPEPGAAAIASAARGGLTIVGDPKQAIYSFRGADVATYLRAREAMLAGGARRIDLTANQRSTRPLVEATNALLAGPAVGLDYFTGAIGYDAPVAAAGRVDASPALPAIVVWDTSGLAAHAKAAARDAHVDAIAVELATLVRGPDALTLRHGDQPPRPLRLDDVLVLTRSNAESRAVAAGLRARGIPCALLLAEYLLATDEARAVADLLAALAAPLRSVGARPGVAHPVLRAVVGRGPRRARRARAPSAGGAAAGVGRAGKAPRLPAPVPHHHLRQRPGDPRARPGRGRPQPGQRAPRARAAARRARSRPHRRRRAGAPAAALDRRRRAGPARRQRRAARRDRRAGGAHHDHAPGQGSRGRRGVRVRRHHHSPGRRPGGDDRRRHDHAAEPAPQQPQGRR